MTLAPLSALRAARPAAHDRPARCARPTGRRFGAVRALGAAALLALTAGGLAGQVSFQSLRPALEARIAKHHGTVGLALLDPKTGETLAIRGDETFPTASVIKVSVLLTLFHRVQDGRLHLDDPIWMVQADQMPGSGILQLFRTPHQLMLEDAAEFMISQSDNTGTNLVIDKVGIRNVNSYADSLGFHHTRLWAKVFQRSGTTIEPDSSKKYGLGVTTPLEMAGMLALIYKGGAVSADASKRMNKMLLDQAWGTNEIPRYLPPEVKVAHKTGSDDDVRNDVAIVYSPARDYVLTIFTRDNADKSWRIDNEAETLMADLGKIVYDGLSAGAKRTAAQ